MAEGKKIEDEILNEVNGGGAIYTQENTSNRNKGDGITNPCAQGNHEFNYGIDDN